MSISIEEYHPYYGNYIDLSKNESLGKAFEKGAIEFQELVSNIPENKMSFSYAEGKWTISELLMHIIDAERVFQHRAFRFARNDKTALPGFEQDEYVPESMASMRSKAEIINEFLAVRNATITLFSSFSDEVLKRMGTASGFQMSVRALGYVICGHMIHHFNILQERYL